MSLEIETKFLVPNTSAEDVFAELTSIDSIAGFILSEVQNLTHTDTYFDSDGQKLLHAQASLRTRKIEQQQFCYHAKVTSQTQ